MAARLGQECFPQFGVTPRDLDKRWSLASPLERELIGAEEGAPLAISEVAKQQFEDWRLMRALVPRMVASSLHVRHQIPVRYTKSSPSPTSANADCFGESHVNLC